MHVLLLTIGSHGDVHPFIGLGLALKERGHHITFSSNDYFRPLAEKAGLNDFVPLGTAEQYVEMAHRPELWERRRGVELLFDFISRGLADVYNVAADHHRAHPSDGIVVSSSLALGARVAQDALHFPMATVHLAPAILRSLIDPAQLPGMFLPRRAPMWFKRMMWVLADRFGIDPIICPSLNAFRAEKNLPPVKRALKDWWHSPDRVLALWTEWFAPMQPDWPVQTRLCGFPLYDETGLELLPEDLLQFLSSGTAPIAFTPGSAMWRGEKFFATAADTCNRLGRRGILLSRSSDHIPKNLPADVLHVPFAPFSQLLPHIAALVHHGGIGTTSQALAAGIPQLVVAMSHDQPDNGSRVRSLGVGAVTTAKRFKSAVASRVIDELIRSPQVAARCREVSEKFGGTDSLKVACDAIEELRNARA